VPCLEVAAIILAAGSATRMGRLKQLLPFKGRPLVTHAIDQARKAQLGPIIVVVGAEASSVQTVIASQPVDVVHNPYWATGMGSSLAAGVKRLQEMDGNWAGVAVLLADQPLVDAEHLSTMRALLTSQSAPIIAAEYNGTVGVPAFFRREMLPQLAVVAPEVGARAILRESGKAVYAFPLPEGAIDVDTPEDFAALEANAS